jgi:hypothetical protein
VTNIAIRGSGLLLIVGAVFLGVAIVTASFMPEQNQPLPPLPNALLFLSSMLFLLSLPAMYARQVDATGWLGLIGHALLQTGMLLLVVVTSPRLLYSSFDLPFEDSLTPFLLGIGLTLGLLVTGIATSRAGVYPRWAGILMLAATFGFFFGFFIAELLPRLAGQVVGAITGILLGLPFAWIGLAMWKVERSRLSDSRKNSL